jgi:glycerophosphoryl diester phosphodiesterase
MDILAHRGLWTEPAEQNALDACMEAWRAGFGIETDIRDRPGELIVSHDPPGPDSLTNLETLLAHHRDTDPSVPLALNIKSCGLATKVAKALADAGTTTAFVFDLAVPDALAYLEAGVPVYTRHSEVEPQPALYERAEGVWLDSFGPEWWSADTIVTHVAAGKKVAVVSPELHKRSHLPIWETLVKRRIHSLPGVSICTDYPRLAQEVLTS